MNARKKVLFVITKSNFGGAQRYVYDLATRLPREKFHIAVACGPAADGTTGRLSHLLNEQEIPTIEVPALRRDMGLVQDMRAFFALAGLFRAEQPDVVHLNSSKAGGLGALAARLAGIKRVVFTVHGLPSDEDRSRFARAAIALATWATIMLSHHTIAISSDAFTRLRSLPFCYRKITLIHNGIEPLAFESPADALKSLRSIDPSIPDSFVGTIAELHPNKDLATAIDAVIRADMHLVVIGDGESRAELEAYALEKGAADRIHFLGFVPDAAKYLRAFSIFLLTSKKEGLPYVLLEAAAAHVPILAVDIPGVHDIVLPDFTGLLAPRDPKAIAHMLRRLADDNALARSLADEMTTRLLKTFAFPAMLEKTAALY